MRIVNWLILPVLLVALLALPSPSSAHNPEAPTATQLGDFVWRDRGTPNGIQESGEGGVPFAPVNLLDQDGNLVAITNADATGIYAIDVITPGDYILQVPNPSNELYGLQRSPQDASSDDTIDSDVDVWLGEVPVTVGVTPDNTLDAAFYNPTHSITYCTGQQMTPTNWNATLTLPQADPALGNLIGVYFRASVGATQDISLTNNDSGTNNFTYSGGSLNIFTLPGSGGVFQVSNQKFTNITLDPGVTEELDNYVSFTAVDRAPIGGGAMGPYIGTGTFSVPASAQGYSAMIGGGNVVFVAETESYSTLCVTYRFDAPLNVELNDFAAQCRVDSEVDVAWETATEGGILGFNVLRATSETETPARLNEELIPAQAPGGGGSAYLWQDGAPKSDGTYFYWLEAVDMQGSASRFGPVNAAVPCAPTAIALTAFQSSTAADAAPLLLMAGSGVLLALGIVVKVLRRKGDSALR